MLIFSLHCTHPWALPAHSSWPLTLRLSFLRRCCCSCLHIWNRSAVTDWGRSVGSFRSVARSTHSPLGRKDGHTASRLIHLKLSLHAVPTRLAPSSAVTLRTVTAHQVLRALSDLSGLCRSPSDQEQRHNPHPKGASVWGPCLGQRAIITGYPSQEEKGQWVYL